MTDLVSRGFTRLSGPARLVVGVLALAGVPLPQADVPQLLDGLIGTDEARDVVRTLVRTRELGYEPPTKQVRLHPLDADYVRHTLIDGDPGTQVDLDLRLAAWYRSPRAEPRSWRVVADVTPNRREFDHRWRARDHAGALTVLADTALFLARKGEVAMLRGAVAKAEPIAGEHGSLVIDMERCRFAAEFFAGSLDASEAALRRIRAEAEAAGRLELLPSVDLDLATVLRHRGDAQGTIDLLAHLTPPPGTVLDHTVEIEAIFQVGLARCYLGDWKGADEAATKLQAKLQPDDPPELAGRPADVRSLALLVAGDYEGAIAAADEGIAIYLESSVADCVGYLSNVRGLALLGRDLVEERGRGAAAGSRPRC